MSLHPILTTRRGIVTGGVVLLVLAGGAGIAVAVGSSGAPSTVVETVGTGLYSKTVQHVVMPAPAGITGVNAPGPGPTIPAGMLPTDAPVPLPPSLINVTNAWEVADGNQLVSVYAGSAGDNPSTGRFVIIRQQFPPGGQTVNVVDVPNSGAVKLVNAPSSATPPAPGAGAGSASPVFTASIPYAAAAGTSGSLSLSNDTATGG
jgi:hypothetical protein